jgi:hypothetical protein
MATPTSTSVGASAPSATRARAARATITVATHLPVLRQRPSGTSVYRIVTRTAANTVIWSDGSAQPPQPVWMTTPNGRGRRAIAATTASATRTVTLPTTKKTINCRKRLSTSSASTRASPSPLRTHQELIAASTRHSPATPGAASPASQLTTASSATVTSTARPRSPRAKTAIVSATSTTAAISQRTPLVCR